MLKMIKMANFMTIKNKNKTSWFDVKDITNGLLSISYLFETDKDFQYPISSHLFLEL